MVPHGVREERQSDLLVRDDEGDKSKLFLRLRDRIRDDQDRHLTAELLEANAEAIRRETYTVITDAPFSIYRFRRRPLAVSATDQTDVVATYNSDMREWRVLRASDTYLFTLPPGAIGEDADKPSRLEIHDPDDRNVAGPVASSSNGVPARHAVDMRYSPPTALWIRPSDLARNYFLPEFAGRALFRQRGDFGLGVRLAGLRTELLYGLSTGLEIKPAIDDAPGPRIAELEAITGGMVQSEDDPSGDFERRWGRLRRTFARRPERLEIWTLDPSHKNPFVPAHFNTGLTFALRNTAFLAPPVASEDVDPSNDAPTKLKSPRFHEHGLSGGALWPFESANVTRVVAENPAATGGDLDKIALSPFGSSGNQTVEFPKRLCHNHHRISRRFPTKAASRGAGTYRLPVAPREARRDLRTHYRSFAPVHSEYGSTNP